MVVVGVTAALTAFGACTAVLRATHATNHIREGFGIEITTDKEKRPKNRTVLVMNILLSVDPDYRCVFFDCWLTYYFVV